MNSTREGEGERGTAAGAAGVGRAEQSFLGSRSQADNRDSEEAQRQLLEPMGRITQGLADILDTYGWPGKSLAGEDGAEAAWTLALHTMHDPDVLRRCLALLEDAAVAGEAEPWQVASLVGPGGAGRTEHPGIWDHDLRQENGGFGPPLPEDPEHIDERRRAVGLPPLEYDIGRIEAYYRRIG